MKNGKIANDDFGPQICLDVFDEPLVFSLVLDASWGFEVPQMANYLI